MWKLHLVVVLLLMLLFLGCESYNEILIQRVIHHLYWLVRNRILVHYMNQLEDLPQKNLNRCYLMLLTTLFLSTLSVD